MSNKNERWTYSWTQGYSINPQYTDYSFNVSFNTWVYTDSAMMQSIEDKLETMDRYPEAEAIIKKVQHG